MLRDDSYPKLLDSRLRGNDGGESSVGFARENKLIHCWFSDDLQIKG